MQRFAPAAAAHARSAGAYREAAAQFARALRFADALSAGERATLLEGRSRALYLADDQVEAIAVIGEAIDCWKEAGAGLAQARALSELYWYLNCRGLQTLAHDAIVEATSLVTDDPKSPEAASVFSSEADRRRLEGDLEGAIELAREAAEVAERAGDTRTAAEAHVTLAIAELSRDTRIGREIIDRTIADCQASGEVVEAARALNYPGIIGVFRYEHELANTYLPVALEHCIAHNLDLWRINVLAFAARSQLDQGHWAEAADAAQSLLEDPRDSPWPHHEALVVLALVRGRRGDPGAREALQTARGVGVSPEEVYAVVDLAAAEAELAWLEGNPQEIDRVTAPMLASTAERGSSDDFTRLSYWRRLGGLETVASDVSGPYAHGAGGAWRESAESWERRGCPYETALALAEADEQEPLMRALEICRELGAGPLATRIVRRLREAWRERRPPRAASGHAGQPGAADRAPARGACPRSCRACVTRRSRSVSSCPGARWTTTCRRSFASSMHIRRSEAVATATGLGVLEDR